MIHYLKGDVTCPQVKGNKIIAHICNNLGKMGAGVALSISKKWNSVRSEYLKLYNKDGLNLGDVQFIQVEKFITVANMIAQEGIRMGGNGIPPIRYKAVEECLIKVADKAKEIHATVNIPFIGIGLAGGSWNKIEPIIKNIFTDVDILIYEWNKK